MSIPNIITLGRIILVPVIVWAIVSSQMEIAFAIFVIAGVSDAVLRGLVNAGALEAVAVDADRPLACPDPDFAPPDLNDEQGRLGKLRTADLVHADHHEIGIELGIAQ